MPHQIPRLTHRVQTRLSWSMRIVWYSKKNHFFPMLSRSLPVMPKYFILQPFFAFGFIGDRLYMNTVLVPIVSDQNRYFTVVMVLQILEYNPIDSSKKTAYSCQVMWAGFGYCNEPTKKSVHTSGQNSRQKHG